MKRYHYLIILLVLILGIATIQAQTDDSLNLSEINPATVSAGQESTVTIRGTNFGQNTSISLSAYGAVPTSFVNENTLRVTIPSNLAVGSYVVTATRQNGTSSANSLSLTVQAQSESPSNQDTQLASVVVVSVEPRQLQAGTEATITIIGSGFTNDLVVRLQGYGLLPTTFVNSSALTAQVPANVAARENGYSVELLAGNGTSYSSQVALRLVAPQIPTDVPPPTDAPMPTEPPPVPNTEPMLQVSSFSVEPGTIDAGQSATIHFTVTNRGNETARAITVTLGSSAGFFPAAGQLGVVLPDLAAGASASGQMSIVSSLEIASGPNIAALSLAYQNPMGENFSASAELSVMVSDTPLNSQLIVDAYTLEPSMVEAGQPVTLRLTLLNVGDSTASQVMLRVGGEGGVLLPNGHGDAYPIGDIESRQHAPVELSLLVNSHAESGHQIQPISINYFQNGETREISSNVVVDVAASNRPEPLLLLASYDTGAENLRPGSRFTLNITVENAGAGDARNTLVSFGSVSAGASAEGGTGTEASTSFAPVGTAGLDFVGDIASGGQVESSQEFMVAANLPSGIYALPISFDYLLPDGTAEQVTLNISILVIMPPQLEVVASEALPSSINVGETAAITLDIKNNGRTINLDEAVFTIENGEIIDGASIPLEILREGEDTSITALLIPAEEGVVEVTLTLHYTDELNEAQTMVFSYSSEAFELVMVEDYIEEAPIIEAPVAETEVNWFGRIMMALLGLGS